MAGETRVTIADGWAVYVHGEQHSGGNTVEVDPDTARHWISRGWATAAPAGTAAKPARSPRRTSTS